MTKKMQLCRIIYYSIVLLYMFRSILSLIIRNILTVITASVFIHMYCCRLLSWLSHDSRMLCEQFSVVGRITRTENYAQECVMNFNPLNPELNPICYFLALLGAHHFLHVSRIRVKLLTFRLLMSYIYIWSTHS